MAKYEPGAMRSFSGSEDYILSAELKSAVNVAIALQKPLLVKGEPGTGKTMLAKSIADSLSMELLIWNIKSTTKAQDGLYIYDTVQRLYDSQFGEGQVSDIRSYIRLGQLGRALSAQEQVVLLIDEIDKADLEFPNDLLWELDQMEFFIAETRDRVVKCTPEVRQYGILKLTEGVQFYAQRGSKQAIYRRIQKASSGNDAPRGAQLPGDRGAV